MSIADRGVAKLDVAVVGGGMAGNLLARQLSRRLPGRRIALFEKRSEYSHSVGESLVEIASNYLIRRLGLSSYLYDRHLPKNGLRFFFDSEDRDTPLQQMSEIGSGLAGIVVAKVLAARLADGRVSLADAELLARKLLYENNRRIYNCPAT